MTSTAWRESKKEWEVELEAWTIFSRCSPVVILAVDRKEKFESNQLHVKLRSLSLMSTMVTLSNSRSKDKEFATHAMVSVDLTHLRFKLAQVAKVEV